MSAIVDADTPDEVADTDPKLWSGPQAARISGLSYRMVDYAARKGYVEPDVVAEGSGTRRGYTIDGLVKLRLAYHLANSVTKKSMPWGLLKQLVETGSGSVGLITFAADMDRARAEVNDRLRFANDRRVVIGTTSSIGFDEDGDA